MSGQGKKGGEQEGEKGKKAAKVKKPFSPALEEAIKAVGQIVGGKQHVTYQGRENPEEDAKRHTLTEGQLSVLLGINPLKRKLSSDETGAEQTTQGAGQTTEGAQAKQKSDAIRRTPGAKKMS